jgi:azurin
MKKNLLLCGIVSLLISCEGMHEGNMAVLPSMSIPVDLPFKVMEIQLEKAFDPLNSKAADGIERDRKINQDGPRSIWIEVVPDLMKYDTDTFKVKPGEQILLELDNLDGMQHNLLIAKPGTLEKVGEAADAMLRDPKAAEKHYIPEIPEVLFFTEMVDPGEVFSLKFTAPESPGNYPFVCTFPGHWRMMNGIMVVEET